MTVREARRALGWTQMELAATSGVDQRHISALELNKIDAVSYVTVAKIVRAFHKAGLKGLTAEELFPIEERV